MKTSGENHNWTQSRDQKMIGRSSCNYYWGIAWKKYCSETPSPGNKTGTGTSVLYRTVNMEEGNFVRSLPKQRFVGNYCLLRGQSDPPRDESPYGWTNAQWSVLKPHTHKQQK